MYRLDIQNQWEPLTTAKREKFFGDMHRNDEHNPRASLAAKREDFYEDLVNGAFESRQQISEQMAKLRLSPSENITYCVISTHNLRKESSNLQIWWLRERADRQIGILCVDHTGLGDDSALTTIKEELTAMALKSPYTTMGVSKFCKDPLLMPELYAQSVKALEVVRFAGSCPIIYYQEIEEAASKTNNENIKLESLLAKLKAMWLTGSRRDIEAFVDDALKRTPFPDEYQVRSLTFTIINLLEMELETSTLSLENLFGSRTDIYRKVSTFDRYFDIRQWLINIIYEAIAYQKQESLSPKGNIVAKIKDIIKKQHTEISTVAEIAGQLFFSVSYISHVFKESTGKTIIEYLTEYRINKAMHLLLQPEAKIGTILEQVGFKNKSHFTLIFKKHTGYTPAEYRKRMTC